MFGILPMIPECETEDDNDNSKTQDNSNITNDIDHNTATFEQSAVTANKCSTIQEVNILHYVILVPRNCDKLCFEIRDRCMQNGDSNKMKLDHLTLICSNGTAQILIRITAYKRYRYKHLVFDL
ncbi:hypothetical protein GJ496_008214 [Pomphorhynchus laevis]|nr:hypothetical protein GJ496_008214 [Pomphorhynchus laevis]